MKRTLLLIALVLCCATAIFAQNNKISYQAVVRDAQNRLVDNRPVTVTVSIFNGSATTAAYSETQEVTTNVNGLISLLVGGGTVTGGNWESIDWKTARIETAVALNGATLGMLEIPFTAVPYAMYAEYADSATLADHAMNAHYSDSVNLNVIAHYLSSHNIPDGAGVNAQSDWNQTDILADDYIKNKPTNVSAFANDANYATQTEVAENVDSVKGNLRHEISTLETAMTNADAALAARIVADSNRLVALKNRVNTFNTHLCDSVDTCVKNIVSDTATALRGLIKNTDDKFVNYYTKTEVNANVDSVKINLRKEIKAKADTGSVYTRDQINTKLADTAKYATKVKVKQDSTYLKGLIDANASAIPTTVAQLTDANNYVTTNYLNEQHYVSNASCNTVDICTLAAQMAKMQETIDSLKGVIAAVSPKLTISVGETTLPLSRTCNASLHNADIGNYTLKWTVDGTDSTTTNNPLTVNFTTEGTHKVICTATRDGYATLKDSVNITVAKGTPTVTAPTAVAASLTYSGSAQTLFNAGLTTGGTMKYMVTNENSKPTNTSDFKTTIDQGTNAGTYYLWYYVDGGLQYNSTSVNSTAISKAIAKANASVTTAPTNKAPTYSGSAQAYANAGTASGGTMMYCSTEDGTYLTDFPTATNAGNYTLWYYVEGDDNHNSTSKASVSCSIAKATPNVTAPTAKSETFTYNGNAQTLFNTGSTNAGTMKYKVTTTNSEPSSTSDFKTTIDQGTNAGTYYLWYYVEGNDNHNSTSKASVSCSIAKASPNVTAPTAKSETFTYNGNAQTLFNTGSTNAGTMKYKVTTTNSEPSSTADFKTTIDQGTNAGTYYLWYYVEGDDNHNSTSKASVSCSIAKATPNVTAPTAKSETFTYNGNAQTLFNTGSTNAGTMKYKVTTTNSEPSSTADFKTTIDQGTNAGTYYLWYYVDGGDNYNTTDVNGTAVTKAIGKAAATLTCSNAAISFTQSEATNSTKTRSASVTNGTISVSSSDASKVTASYSNGTITLTRKTDVAFSGVTITVSVTPDGNHIAPSSVTFNVSAVAYDPGVALASSSAGYIVSSNGKAYPVSYANSWNSSWGTKAGVVVYKSGSSGFVVSLYNCGGSASSDGTTYTWANRTDGLSSVTSVSGRTWIVGSEDQYTTALTSQWSTAMGYITSAGGSTLVSLEYWSCTEDGSNFGRCFYNGGWFSSSKSFKVYVRPCFAF